MRDSAYQVAPFTEPRRVLFILRGLLAQIIRSSHSLLKAGLKYYILVQFIIINTTERKYCMNKN